MSAAGADVVRDERTVAVENASCRLAYNFLTYAVLLDVVVRSLVWREAPWELMAIVMGGAAIGIVYQGAHGVLTRNSVKVAVLAFLAAGVVGFLAAVLKLAG
jgi:hypothetical protein